jgi:hypothetical protein
MRDGAVNDENDRPDWTNLDWADTEPDEKMYDGS